MRTFPLLLLLLGATCLPGQEAGTPEKPTDDGPLTPRERAVHALSRLSFGPTPGQVDAVLEQGLEAWIEQQLDPELEPGAEIRKRLQSYTTLGLTPGALQARADTGEMNGEEDARARRAALRRQRRKAVRELREAVVLRGRYSRRQLFEVLADFWRNHFNVDADKSATVRACLSEWEHAVIRPHVFGRFGSFLEATAKHPAMLVYLDNYLSRKPPSEAELRRIERRVRRRTGSRERARQQVEIAQQRGLNENYARELMELHTLGVDNGYTQDDVEAVARAFTGWTIRRQEGDVLFEYREAMHDGSRKSLMRRPLPRGRREEGIVEGESILGLLSSHSNTAHFLARKLCVRLVSDQPPEEMVEDAAKAYLKSKGDLRETVKAIVTHERFFDRAHFQQKFKTPLEFVISAVRITGAEVSNPGALVREVAALSMPIYGCEDPTGYYDTTEAWRDPGVMALRWKLTMDLARDRLKGVRIPESFYDGLPDDVLEIPYTLAERILPQGLGPHTSRVLERVLFREVQKAGSVDKIKPRSLARLFTGILLGSPEFQQQ